MSLQAAFCNKPDAKAALCAIKSNISLVERQAISDNLKDDSSVSDQGKEGFIYDFPIFFKSYWYTVNYILTRILFLCPCKVLVFQCFVEYRKICSRRFLLWLQDFM